MKVIAKSLEDTKQFARDVLEKMLKNKYDSAVVLDLKGDLGAGKTMLVQMLGRELGVSETIQSPTFVLMKTYRTKNSLFKNLVHIDTYRIEHIDEVKILQLEDIFVDPQNLVCIEWSEKIKEVMPENSIKIECELLENNAHSYNTVL